MNQGYNYKVIHSNDSEDNAKSYEVPYDFTQETYDKPKVIYIPFHSFNRGFVTVQAIGATNLSGNLLIKESNRVNVEPIDLDIPLSIALSPTTVESMVIKEVYGSYLVLDMNTATFPSLPGTGKLIITVSGKE